MDERTPRTLATGIGEFEIKSKKRWIYFNGKPLIQWSATGRPYFDVAISASPGKTDAMMETGEDYFGDLAIWKRNRSESKDWNLQLLPTPSLRLPGEHDGVLQEINQWLKALEDESVFYLKKTKKK